MTDTPPHSGERVEPGPISLVYCRRSGADPLSCGLVSCGLVACDNGCDEAEADFLPTQALSALVEKWTKRARHRQKIGGDAHRPHVRYTAVGAAQAYERAVTELRQLLDPPEGQADAD